MTTTILNYKDVRVLGQPSASSGLSYNPLMVSYKSVYKFSFTRKIIGTLSKGGVKAKVPFWRMLMIMMVHTLFIVFVKNFK